VEGFLVLEGDSDSELWRDEEKGGEDDPNAVPTGLEGAVDEGETSVWRANHNATAGRSATGRIAINARVNVMRKQPSMAASDQPKRPQRRDPPTLG